MDIKMENIVNMTISDYISLLSSKESIPGGGTTSAITAVMGVSLYLMVKSIYREWKIFAIQDKSY